MLQLPIFPLSTIVFPGCRQPLQIFEQRYLEMITTCLKQDSGFVTVLISKGLETGTSAEIFTIGTLVEIVDWNSLENGLLSITVEGRQRATIEYTSRRKDGLLIGEVTPLEQKYVQPTEEFESFIQLLQNLQQHPLVKKLGINVDYDNCESVIWCLCGLLPFSNREKQYLLELDDLDMLIAALDKMLKSLEGG